MFKRISYRIALQFTAFVFVLLLINGAIFLAADFQNARRQTHFRLDKSIEIILKETWPIPTVVVRGIPPHLRERLRITDATGESVFTGSFFDGIPFDAELGYSEINVGGDQYRIRTSQIARDGVIVGYAQIADLDRLQLHELPLRAALYLLVSILISGLTFLVGLFFARRSLKPAEQMMERLEQFTQDASHELRTPLATLRSSLDLALRSRKYREGIASAIKDVDQVTVLVERLLELTRLDTFTLHPEKVDLTGLLEQTLDKHEPLAREKNVKIERTIKTDVHVKGDAALIRQVLNNLLSNAIKFSKSDGGTIRVHLTKDHLIIEDTGVGIPNKDIPHIFDRFYQADTSRSNNGLGLGLSLVKRIIDLHGWGVGVESREGEGTKFKIKLH